MPSWDAAAGPHATARAAIRASSPTPSRAWWTTPARHVSWWSARRSRRRGGSTPSTPRPTTRTPTSACAWLPPAAAWSTSRAPALRHPLRLRQHGARLGALGPQPRHLRRPLRGGARRPPARAQRPRRAGRARRARPSAAAGGARRELDDDAVRLASALAELCPAGRTTVHVPGAPGDEARALLAAGVEVADGPRAAWLASRALHYDAVFAITGDATLEDELDASQPGACRALPAGARRPDVTLSLPGDPGELSGLLARALPELGVAPVSRSRSSAGARSPRAARRSARSAAACGDRQRLNAAVESASMPFSSSPSTSRW